MRLHRAEQFDRMFPYFITISIIFLLTQLLTSVFQTANRNYVSLVQSGLVFITVSIWGVIRKTSAKHYSMFIISLYLVAVSIFNVLVYIDGLPIYLRVTDYNLVYLGLATYYLGAAGLGCYDFKINIFLYAPVILVSSYIMSLKETQR